MPLVDCRRVRIAVILALVTASAGCQVWPLARYLIAPDYPTLRRGERLAVPGLLAPVEVTQKSDGFSRIVAANEHDALLAEGYVMARDRMAQLDLTRHMARGELAELLGNRRLGERTTLDLDRLHRFLGFRDHATILIAGATPQEQAALAAFTQGVNAWIESGPLPLEHRLLGIDRIRPWAPEDSTAIYLFLMHGLSGNADREIRRLVIACGNGLDAMERVWPTDLEFSTYALPPEDLRPETYPAPPAVVPELAAELAERCAEGRHDTFDPAARRATVEPAAGFAFAALPLLAQPGSASNNWVTAGSGTRSGRPVLSNDPHLPFTNPPIFWGVDLEYPGTRVAGFTIAGLHRLAIGHNGSVAWATTTNHVDRQDLVVHRARSETHQGATQAGYDVEGTFVPFGYRTERFGIHGDEPVDVTVRLTRDGPLMNDLDPFVAGRIPLTAIRLAPVGRGTDLDAAAAMSRAHNAGEVAAALAGMDQGCQNWVIADSGGSIGYRSPCVLPLRPGWRGTFPVPGWLERYRWPGFVPKSDLPAATDPARGWLVTANGQVIPSNRFPTSYNNDATAPNRFVRIAGLIETGRRNGGLTAADSAAIAHDRAEANWPALRARIEADFCADRAGSEAVVAARRRLCAWDGSMDPQSPVPTLFILWSNALLDRAIADDVPGGAAGQVWRWVQALVQFEADAQWLWTRPDSDPVWDDVGTPATESRADIFRLAFEDAVAEGERKYGTDFDEWQWGRARPFVLEHAFAGGGGGVLGAVLNSSPFGIGGGNETVFKQQFLRSDRERLHPGVGPVVRFTVDLAEPWSATYSIAGGASGWPRSPHYGDRVADWAAGREHPLTPPAAPTDTRVTLVPAPA